MTKIVEIYTDGACSGNPGPGGWGVLLRYGENEKELCGGEAETTNNRMEMMAVIKALESLKGHPKIELYTDSKYVMQGITEWMDGWKAKGWKTASKKPVKNVDLWQQLEEQTHAESTTPTGSSTICARAPVMGLLGGQNHNLLPEKWYMSLRY